MRPLPIVLCLSLLLLTACGGSPPPTVTPTLTPPPSPTPTPVNVESSGAALPTLPPDIAPSAADSLPGTLAVRSTAGTPAAPASPPFSFRLISFYQQGGIARETVSVTVYSDGRLIRDGVESRIDQAQIDALNAALGEVNFINIEGTFQSGAPLSAERFQYSLSVEAADGASRTLNTEDGLTPDALYALYDLIKALR